MIRIKGVNKYFNKGRQNEIHVINNVNLELPEKGMVAIFGKSGCGKTTLLNVIGGLDGFSSGSLSIENQDIRHNTDDIRNKYIGYIFQNYNLNKAESCFDNVADALRLCGMTDSAQIEARVSAALKNVGMDKYGKRTPDTLSGGQQQRIAIARAIVKNPRIILADEPTGNLDEANTVMIMDLLKAISRDHLVLLVTHEANLVDYYCDTVIELADGKVASVRRNSAANGFAARDKNDIYLGELRKSELRVANACVEYYGEATEEPVNLRIINNGGKLYVQINTEKVQIIDRFSEIKLREGVYEEKTRAEQSSQSIDMSALPPVEGSSFGKLFTFGASVKSGYDANFKNRKKGKKLLRNCMSLFAAVIVFMTAVFGTVFGDIINARNSYNHNVFYVYTPDGDVSSKLLAAVGDADTGIDYIRLNGGYSGGDAYVYFTLASFETFEQSIYESNFETNAVYLDLSLARDLPVVAGKKDGLAIEEIVITTKVANTLLEKSSLGYISEPKDLIGLVSNIFTVDGKNLRIAGVVESDETAIYLTELAMAKYVRNGVNVSYTMLASEYAMDVAAGEAVLAIRNRTDKMTYPKVGETVTIQGREFVVSDIKEYVFDYFQWMELKGIKKKTDRDYFTDIIKEVHPNIDVNSAEFLELFDKAVFEKQYEYYAYLYSDIYAFLEDMYMFEPTNMDLWMYFKKGVAEMKYLYAPDNYYKAEKYKELYGKYPTWEELDKVYHSLPELHEEIKKNTQLYEQEFYDEIYGSNSNHSYFDCAYLVSDSDYIALSKQLGDTHPSADRYYDAYGDSDYKDYYYFDMTYTVIHSSDPEKTEAWINSEFSDLESPLEYYPAVMTPDMIFDDIISSNVASIIASFIAMGLILVLMSVCMYFIMRSSLMNRIKEVGVYRAIGVSKKNLVFRFFIEALVLACLTVLIGFIGTSAFIYVCLGISSLVSEIFFYPLWLAGAVLAILFALSLFFGTLPVLTLLKRTPSEILAKYDI